MTIEYTEEEKKVLTMLFEMMDKIVEFQGGYIEIDYVGFNGGDLFRLAEKLGIEY